MQVDLKGTQHMMKPPGIDDRVSYEHQIAGKADLKGTHVELDAAPADFDKMKPSGINDGVSYANQNDILKQKRYQEELDYIAKVNKFLADEIQSQGTPTSTPTSESQQRPHSSSGSSSRGNA